VASPADSAMLQAAVGIKQVDCSYWWLVSFNLQAWRQKFASSPC